MSKHTLLETIGLNVGIQDRIYFHLIILISDATWNRNLHQLQLKLWTFPLLDGSLRSQSLFGNHAALIGRLFAR